ncbi:MAG TPA: GMC family oxidoreductase [Candidatus Hydrogenedentes bacterium]|nr:GMC family oxidoreductase [Candidatus Hydrogenedentota bacterium]
MTQPEGIPMDAAHLHADVDAAFDAVVVGSGAGGAVIAKELAEGGRRVAIVEEGGYHAVHRDPPFASFARLYRDCGFSGTLGRPAVLTPMGRCFGGTTTINSGTCFRTPESVIARWRDELGLAEIDHAALDRAFDRVEHEINVTVTDLRIMSRGNRIVHELLEREGLHGAPLRRNVRDCEGCGACCYGCTSGAKQSMDRCYLPKALRAGATAYVRARAERILCDAAGRAAGIEAVANGVSGRRLTFRAPVVILACGSLLTPQLLRRNGVARGNPHLGRHLTLHPATKVYAEFEERVEDWKGVPQSYSYDGLRDDGIKFEGASMPPELGAVAMPLVGEEMAHFLKRYAHIASFGMMISDTAEGRMTRVPGYGYVFRYSLTELDLARLRRGIAFLARLYLKHGALAAYPMMARQGSVFRGLDDVDRFERAPLRASEVEVMAFHPLGTCRMAASPAGGVCDQEHQVFGAPGLYVCDGSVVPTALGVNPQVTIMAMATRFAERLLDRELGN